jgi:hypothetical protein
MGRCGSRKSGVSSFLRHLPFNPVIEMLRNATVTIYILVMIALIIGVDVLFLKDRFWLRLFVNVGIVLVFVAIYFAVLRNR